MYDQSGRYDEPLDATIHPPRGGLASKYRATKAPPRREPEAESDVSFSWVNDVLTGQPRNKHPSETPRDLGKSRRGELSNWNGLEATQRGQNYEHTPRIPANNGNQVRIKPPSGNVRSRPPRDPNVTPRKPPMAPRATRDKVYDTGNLHRENVPPGVDESRDESWSGWRSMALNKPGQNGEGWGTLFGQMHLRWSGREQRKQSRPPGSLTIDDETDRRRTDFSGPSEPSNGFSDRASRTKQTRIFVVACILFFVLAVVITVPTVILTLGDDKDPEPLAFAVFTLNVTTNETYDPLMSDKTSDVFITAATEFCAGVEQRFADNNQPDQYQGCEVTDIREGSVIFTFRLTIANTVSATTTSITAILAGGATTGTSFQIGIFTVQPNTLSVISFTATATVTFNNVNCPVQPLQSFQNGIVSYTANAYASTATITCETGYEIQGNATIRCNRRYKWEPLTNCTRITCTNYTAPSNSMTNPVVLSGHTFETNITVTCDTGYVLDGNAAVTCMADGKWSTSPTCNINSCPNDTTLTNGQVNPDPPEITFGSSYTVTCNEGYTLDGESNVTCLATGTWSTNVACNPKECVEYIVPDHSTIDPATTTGNIYQSTLNVTCNVGYDINGHATVTCMANENWSASPNCIIKSCPVITPPDNSQIYPGTPDTTYGSLYNVTCDEGYELLEDGQVECSEFGNWTASPTCNIIVCEDFADIANGQTDPEDTSGLEYNATIDITCNDGYDISTNDIVKCEADMSWSIIPDCEPIECVEFVLPSDSSIEEGAVTTGNSFMTFLTITCDTGYNIIGTAEVTCMADGSWSASPTCDIVVCDDYALPDYAESDPSELSNHPYSTTLEVTCFDGYDINGESTLTCQEDGTWSEGPTCEAVICEEFQAPENGMTDPETTANLPFKSTVEVSCNDGYDLSGNGTVYCQANTSWTIIPSCEPIACEIFTYPVNSVEHEMNIISDNSTRFGEELSVNCSDGYVLIGPKAFSCNSSGHWPNVECNKVECNTTEIEKPFLSVASVVDDVYTMACETGYTLVGNETIACNQGNWTDIPDCEIVSCADLTDPDNGTLDRMTLDYGDTAELTCDPGFEGSGQIECQADGTVNPMPACTAVTCSEFELVNGAVSSDSASPFSYTNEITLTCQEGYVMTGSATLTCTENAIWSENTTCNPVECKEALGIEDGEVIPDLDENLTFGENVTVECNTGFQLNGPSYIACQASGELSELPTCDIVSCPAFEFPENSIINEELNTTYGTNVTIECKDGFDIDGPLYSLCQANKTWSAPGDCEAIQCEDFTLTGDLQTVDATPNITGKVFGESVNLICINNKLLVGAEQISCNADGTWSTNSTECVDTDCNIETFNQPADSEVAEANNTHLQIECNTGYNINGDALVTCENSAWGTPPSCVIVSCGDLESPDNGMVNMQGNTYLATANLTCDMGYEADSSNYFSCLETGEWNDIASCKLVDCGEPDIPEKAVTFTLSGTEYGTRQIDITCVPGYQVASPVNITCTELKTWTGLQPCSRVECQNLQLPENSEIEEGQEDNYFFSDNVTIACNDGYELADGDSQTVMCDTEGNWGDIENCNRVDCGDLELPANAADMDISDTLFGAELNISCDEGYKLNGEALVQCLSNSTWSRIPQCDAIECVEYDIPENGEVMIDDGTTFNMTIEFACDEGYILEGNANITCEADGNWTLGPSCEIVNCDDIGTIENGFFNESIPTTFNQTIEIECDNGYETIGSNKTVCQTNGNWTEIPECTRVSCESIDPPSNGSFGANGAADGSFEDTQTVTCDQGFELDGDMTITCTSMRNWTALPSCNKVKCETYVVPENSVVIDGDVDETYFEGNLTISCIEGYEFEDSNDGVIECLYDKTWSEISACVKVECPLFVDPLNGFIVDNSTDNEFEDTIEVGCDVGYSLTENGTLTCQANKEWTGNPECTIVICEEDPFIDNGYIDVEPAAEREYGDVTPILCDEGYELEMDASVTCEANGSWSGLMNCTLVDCGEFTEMINNATVEVSNGTTYGKPVFIDCNEGFLLVGDSPITCLQSGSWESPPYCEEIICTDPNITAGSYKKENGTIYEVICDEGHVRTGSQFIECQEDGSWDEIPTCTEVICGNFTDGPPDGEIIEITGTRYGDNVTFACNEGFILDGSEIITCNELGSWRPIPTCNITDCGPAPVPTDGYLLHDEPTVFDTTLYLECNEGFELNGSGSVTCQSSGNWSFDAECVEIDCGNVTDNGVVHNITYSDGTKFGSVATVACAEGSVVVGEATSTCTEGSEWTNPLGCSAIEIAFESADYTFISGTPGRVTCIAGNADGWTSVLLTNQIGETLATVNKTADAYVSSTSFERLQVLDSTVVTTNTARVEFEFESVECGDEGMYFCGIVIGDVEDGNLNFDQTDVSVTAEAGEPTLEVSPIEAHNTTVNITCEALLGNNDTDNNTIQLQAKLQTDMGFEVLDSNNENITGEGCARQGRVEFSFLADESWDGAIVKCVVGTSEDEAVIAIPAVSCEGEPTVEFGTLTNATSADGILLEVVCDEGFENLGDATFICTTSGWVGEANCSIIDCGAPIDANNSIYNYFDTSSTTFNSSINGFCDTGYFPTRTFGDVNLIICGADGNWNSSFTCDPTDCGNFSVPTNASVTSSNGTTYNSIVEITCDEGFNLVGSPNVICDDTGNWEGISGETPACTIIGGLSVDPVSQTVDSGDSFTTTCTLLATPGWNRIGLFRPSEEELNMVAYVDQTSENVYENITEDGVEIVDGSAFFADNATLVVRVNNASCEASGGYFCGALKGAPESDPTDANSLTAEASVIVPASPEEPTLTVSSTDLTSTDVVTLACTGIVGQTVDGNSIAQVEIQIKYNGTDVFENITFGIEPEVNQTGCLIEHAKSINVEVNTTFDGAIVRCITHYGTSMIVTGETTLNVISAGQTAFQIQAISEEGIFLDQYIDRESPEFAAFADDFCAGVENMYANSDLSAGFDDCMVESLSPGSIIVVFTVTFKGSVSPSEVAVIDIILGADSAPLTVSLGQFVYTKVTVDVLSVTTEDETGGSFSFGSSSPFTIGEPNSLDIVVGGVPGWSKGLQVYRSQDGIQTSVLNLTTEGASSAFDHIDVTDSSSLLDDSADVTVEFSAVQCDDDGTYMYALELGDGTMKEVTTDITTEYTPEIKLIQPIQIREDRWTLNITCEASFLTSENRQLSWLLKRDGEAGFTPYSPEDNVQDPVEFTSTSTSPPEYPCLTELVEYFDMETTVDTWNNTEIRCALDYGTDQEVLSDIGVFRIVPKSVCDGKNENEYVQNPLECRKKIQCRGAEFDEWAYIYESACLAGTCWVGLDDNGQDVCEEEEQPPTEPPPGTPYVSCTNGFESATEGTSVTFECRLRDIDLVTSLNISRDGALLASETGEEDGIFGNLVIGEGVTVDIDGESMNVTVEAYCDSEGVYSVKVNNVSSPDLTVALTAEPETPELEVDDVVYLNQRTELACTGNVGRGTDGMAAVELALEIRKRDSDSFELLGEDVDKDRNETECVIIDTARATVYFGEEFNQSTVRCVARKDDVIMAQSTERSITLQESTISFVESDISSTIGGHFSLECNVNSQDLHTLKLTKDGATIAMIYEDGTDPESNGVDLLEGSLTGTEGHLKVNFTSAECSNKGEYICQAVTTNGDTLNSRATVTITRKPETPDLDPSLQMIEGVAPWAVFPTRCYGEVGYPQGTISLETNKDGDGFVAVGGADAVYTVDDDTCSTLGNITFYDTYNIDWDNTDMRCVTRNSEIGDTLHEYPVTKLVNIIPASFCDDRDDADVVEHPYYCYGQLTCSNGVPIPLHLCGGDNTQCYDWSTSVCVSCEEVNRCDVGSTPAPTIPPGTPVMNCTKKVENTKNAIVSIACDLTNANITLSELSGSSNVVMTKTSDGDVILDTSTSTLAVASETEPVYVDGSVAATITSDRIRIDVRLMDCELAGDYTVTFNGDPVLTDETEMVVTANPTTPVYSQSPSAFYEGQSVTIECQGNVGGPKESEGTLALMYQPPDTDVWTNQEGGETVEVDDEDTCGVIVTQTHEIGVTAGLEGYKYACQTNTPDGQSLMSTEKVVAVEEPVVSFGDASTSIAIGDPLTVTCTWDTAIENASANIRRRVDPNTEELVLEYVHGSSSVTSELVGISGSFTVGDGTSPNSLSMLFDEVKCSDEAMYVCDIMVDGELIAEAEKNIIVTNVHGMPSLTLPRALVVDERTKDLEPLKCSGVVPYPYQQSSMRVEYYDESLESFEVFNGDTMNEEQLDTNCVSQVNVSFKTITFTSEWNGTLFRCAVYDDDTLLATSPSATVQLITNECSGDNNDHYFYHPYDCRSYTRCFLDGQISVNSCNDLCPSVTNNGTGFTCVAGDCDC